VKFVTSTAPGCESNGNEAEGYITNVIDTAGGIYQLKYDTAFGLLTNLTCGQWQVNFAYDATNRLISKTLTNTSDLYTNLNTIWQFQYDTNGLLAGIIDPRGNTNILVQYDQYGRQTNQVDALGRSAATRYCAPGNRQITRSLDSLDHKCCHREPPILDRHWISVHPVKRDIGAELHTFCFDQSCGLASDQRLYVYQSAFDHLRSSRHQLPLALLPDGAVTLSSERRAMWS
jgi:YD repeat-containing protein